MAVIWDIVNVDSTIETGTCDVLHWTAIDFEVVEGVTHTGRMYGHESLIADPAAEGFIAFADVTKANCITWVKETLGTEKVAEIEAEVSRQVTESKTPVIRNTNPWEMGDDF